MRAFLRTALAVIALIVAALALIAAEPAAGDTRAPAAGAPPSFPLIAILDYHDLSSDPRAPLEAVRPEFLSRQIQACKAAGWTFLPLSELIAAREHPERLPPRVMVLTFDDGYASFSERALPILAAERVKATLAVITSFVGQPPRDLPPMMTWEQIRAAEASGWVEIASHTHALHGYETLNPWRDTAPAVTTRRYRADQRRYEDRDEYRARLRADFEQSQKTLVEQLGHAARVLAWPYGERNRAACELAKQAGFEVTLALGARSVRREDLESGCLPRVMVTRNLAIQGDGAAAAWLDPPQGAIRAARVDLDDLWDPDTAAFRARVDRVIEKIREVGATHVFLQACPDPRRGDRPGHTWFMNHQAKVAADAWSMVAAKLAHAKLRTWLRAPSMSLPWAWEAHPEWRLAGAPDSAGGDGVPWPFRLSPDLPEVHRAAVDFIADAAVYLPIEGVVFEDDASAREEESLSGDIHSSAEAKAEAIAELHREMMGAVRVWRPDCRFARIVRAAPVEKRGTHPAFAADYARCLATYDLTVVVIDPLAEGHAGDAARWTATLARKAARRWKDVARAARGPSLRAGSAPARASALASRAGEAPPVMFEIEARDGRGRWLTEKDLRAIAAEARRAGVVHLGVGPLLPDRGSLPDRLLEAAPPADLAIGAGGR